MKSKIQEGESSLKFLEGCIHCVFCLEPGLWPRGLFVMWARQSLAIRLTGVFWVFSNIINFKNSRPSSLDLKARDGETF
jgi:hypothetical protein